MSKPNRSIWGWAIYDWANSAFATTVMAGLFPIFFKDYCNAGVEATVSTARLGFTNSIASLFVALLAPVLGAIADKGSLRKRFLILFAYLGVLMTAALAALAEGQWLWACFIYGMGLIGFAGANTFYDSLLPSISREDNVDRISGLGFAMGYLGGGLLFLANVLMVIKPAWFGFANATVAVKVAFLTVAAWWGGFTILTILWVPADEAVGRPHAMTVGFRQLAITFRKIRQMRMVWLFLLAYWFYIDGVDTIIKMAVDYGSSLGFDRTDLIKALLLVQFVGFPAALVFGRLGQAWGARKGIILALCAYMGVTLWGTMITRPAEFYALAVAIGLVQGGIQALSRSYYARLIPAGQAAEFYGFYNMMGKFAAIMGPALMGVVGMAARRALMPDQPTAAQVEHVGHLASRWGIGSLLLLFVVGLTLFLRVRLPTEASCRNADSSGAP